MTTRSSYSVAFKPGFFKDLKKLPKDVRERLDKIIGMIQSDPFAVSSKKLVGHAQLYRHRLGDYRLVYYLDTEQRKVLFLLMAHRREVYRELEKMR
ncbi:MAG: type II toxin-antitoxin system RelE/ParE family toxin [Deltaproteobacteria bacterium]|nr:type II toxin-antitoxin system RelE/ParE family toxin [Deltaproteobacteria bacterium]